MSKKNLANIITISRIIGTMILIFLDVSSLPFKIIYSWCGISDVLDGFIARKLKISSELGSKLDSISDLFLYSMMLLKVWPVLMSNLPQYAINMINVIIGVRLLCYGYVMVKSKVFESRHTILNKITGFAMFCLPFVIDKDYLIYYCFLIMFIASISTIEEIIYLFNNR